MITVVVVGNDLGADQDGDNDEKQSEEAGVQGIPDRHGNVSIARCHHRTPLNLFPDDATHDARRLDEEYKDQNGEDDAVLPYGEADRGDERLQKSDGKPADHGARDGADAAQDRPRQRL